MALRSILGMSWSVVTGLAGGWLVLAPWALGEQGWWATPVTKSQLGAGLGLIALALAGIAVVAAQAVRTLREAGALGRPRARDGLQGVTASADMERALIDLARSLAEDLDARRETAAPAGGGDASWRQPS